MVVLDGKKKYDCEFPRYRAFFSIDRAYCTDDKLHANHAQIYVPCYSNRAFQQKRKDYRYKTENENSSSTGVGKCDFSSPRDKPRALPFYTITILAERANNLTRSRFCAPTAAFYFYFFFFDNFKIN